jgi:hypothetical protein
MAGKMSSDDKNLMELKLKVLNDYLAHHDQALKQFDIDIQKAEIRCNPEHFGDFASRVLDAIDKVYTAGPATSLIAADLV